MIHRRGVCGVGVVSAFAFLFGVFLPLLPGMGGGRATASTDRLTLHYALSAGGLDVAQGRIGVDLAAGGYILRTDLNTMGIAALVVDFSSHARSSGVLGSPGEVVRPRRHQVDNRWNGKARSVDLRYPEDAGPPQAEVVPAPQVDDREPVSPADTAGTLDPLSAAFSLLRVLPAGGAAEPAVTVFDGRRLYTLSAGCLTAQRVEAPVYQGQGWQVTLRYVRLGGRSARSFFRESHRPAEATVDLAPGTAFGLSRDILVPLRVVVPTAGFGSLVALLTETGEEKNAP